MAHRNEANYKINPDGEEEKFCVRCREWWPADHEFYYYAEHGYNKLQTHCKACCIETWKYKQASSLA